MLFILCAIYSRTLARVATVICWLYSTLNRFYLIILSYLILKKCGLKNKISYNNGALQNSSFLKLTPYANSICVISQPPTHRGLMTPYRWVRAKKDLTIAWNGSGYYYLQFSNRKWVLAVFQNTLNEQVVCLKAHNYLLVHLCCYFFF